MSEDASNALFERILQLRWYGENSNWVEERYDPASGTRA